MNNLKEAVSNSGVKLKFIASSLNITPVALNSKLEGKTRFYVDEAFKIIELCGLDKKDIALFLSRKGNQ